MILYCGPCRYNFGNELCWFNPIARLRWREMKPEHTIVQAPATSKYLYEFADEFIPMDIDSEDVRGTARGHSFPRKEVSGEVCFFPKVKEYEHGTNRESRLHRAEVYERTCTPQEREWRDLRPTRRKHVADILCAFPVPKPGGDKIARTYPYALAEELVHHIQDQGKTVACFGGHSNLHIPGTIDLTGASLEEQCGALGAAKAAVGPSSATMHLATLCFCPVYVWRTGGTQRDRRLSIHRYTEFWNPFGTPVDFSEDAVRHPEPYEVATRIRLSSSL